MSETPKYNPSENKETKQVNVGKLDDFDLDYFKSMKDNGGWIAIGNEDYKNQRYFTAYSDSGEKIGIIGVYDFDDEQNITHTVVDPKYRGQGLAAKFKYLLMDKLGLPFINLTIEPGNKSSIISAEKMIDDAKKGTKLKGVKVSDDNKVKYRFEKL